MANLENKLTEQEFELEKIKANKKGETFKLVIGVVVGVLTAALTYSVASNANNIALLDSDRDHQIATELLTIEKNKPFPFPAQLNNEPKDKL